jgi:hypothetical protein
LWFSFFVAVGSIIAAGSCFNKNKLSAGAGIPKRSLLWCFFQVQNKEGVSCAILQNILE